MGADAEQAEAHKDSGLLSIIWDRSPFLQVSLT